MAGELLDRVVLTDRVVTGDALYCNRKLCEQVMEAGGDYLMIVKANQKSLYEDIELCFEEPLSGFYAYAETEGSHGDRRERRRLWATDMLRTYLDWPGQRQVLKVESWRAVKGKQTRQVRYAITSLGPRIPAARLMKLVRGHWGIENRLHYVRDVTMGEDGSQARTDSAPQMMDAVRNLVVSILRMRGERNIAAAIRKIGWKPNGALETLGLMI
ncbi:MAG: ISAs1 family transposase [Dehalococcoidia bacterium]|nr:ISAs1 family transposase [Dehalococcoidia bacterium]